MHFIAHHITHMHIHVSFCESVVWMNHLINRKLEYTAKNERKIKPLVSCYSVLNVQFIGL